MEVTYRRNLNKSYMCIREQETVQEEYELVMLESQKIPCLLPIQISVVDGKRNYLYEISGKQQIEDYLSGKKMDYGILCKLLFSIQELCSVLPEYLLREERISLETKFIYVSLEDGSLYFTYLPFREENLPKAFEHFMEQILRKIDHQDHAATELGYRVYQACTQGNANMQKMLEAALEKKVPEDTGREMENLEEIEDIEVNEAAERRKNFDKYRKAGRGGTENRKNGNENRKAEWNKEKKDMHQKAMERIHGLLPSNLSIDKLSADKLFANIKEKLFAKRSSIKKSSEQRFSKRVNKEPEALQQEIGQNDVTERETVSHPTEILGIHRQEPTGKLIYQGIHGCADFIIEGQEYLLGKNGQQADGVIDAEGVSRLHARISREGNIYYIEDLNSTNGTYLNEIQLEYHQKKALDKNDRIRFAAEEYVFC